MKKLNLWMIWDSLECMKSWYLTSYRIIKAHSSQHALFKLLQPCQRELDESWFVSTILMGFSKAYDCIPHEPLIAKWEAYGLHKNSLNLLADYLSGRKQRKKIDSAFSGWWKKYFGIPQGSILGPLLVIIFINDLLFFVSKCDINNNSMYLYSKLPSKILSSLRFDLKNVLMWFTVNSLKPNPGKLQDIILRKCVTNQLSLFINGTKTERKSEIVSRVLKIDDQLTLKRT